MNDRIYMVVYDIVDPRRLRRVHRLMRGFGEWLQLSVFQCRLSKYQHAYLISELSTHIHHKEDHVLIVDLGPAERVHPRVVSLGKTGYDPIVREPTIV